MARSPHNPGHELPAAAGTTSDQPLLPSALPPAAVGAAAISHARHLPAVGRAAAAAPAAGLSEQLAALWADLSRRPLWRRPYTWRYLRLAWATRLTMLDPARLTVAVPAGKVNHCAECLDNCCIGRASTVSLGLSDLARLLDLGRADLLARDKPRFSASELAANPALRRTVASNAWAIFPVLRQNSFGACQALDLDGRCTLYPRWPLSCARFPYALHADDRVVFYSPRCPAWRLLPAAQAAPRVQAMVAAAVEAYNGRIRDLLLLRLVPEELRRLGLTEHLSAPERW